MPNILIEQFPRLFEAAIKTSLGVFALLACGVGLLAWYFFGKERWGVKMAAFILSFGGVCALGYAVVQQAKDAQAAEGVRRTRIAECVSSALNRFQDRKTQDVRNQVRCEGAGAGGGGHTQTGVISYSAPPGYVIVGRPEVLDVHQSRGNQGALQFTQHGGTTTGASLPISCSSPSQMFGPGAWMGATLRSTIERPIQDSDRTRIEKECSAASP